MAKVGRWEWLSSTDMYEVPEIRRNEEKGGAALSYHEMQDNERNGLRGETTGK